MRSRTRKWTLGGAAAAGSILTSVLGAPLAQVFGSFVPGANLDTTLLAVPLFAMLALTVAWMFYSK